LASTINSLRASDHDAYSAGWIETWAREKSRTTETERGACQSEAEQRDALDAREGRIRTLDLRLNLGADKRKN